VVVDIIFVILAIAFAVHGVITGAMRGLLYLTTGIFAIVVSLLIAFPIALLLSNSFGWNRLLVMAIAAVIIYIIIRIIVFVLSRYIKRLKEQRPTLNKIDRGLGLFVGLLKFFFYCLSLTFFLALLANAGPLARIPEWIFNDSTVAAWAYDLMSDWVVPLVTKIGAGVINTIT